MKCPQKLDKNSTQKLFKQPKGLAVCELQAVSPLVLRVGGADKNLDSQRALERSPFVYSYEKKSIALKVFQQTNSESFIRQCVAYQLDLFQVKSYFLQHIGKVQNRHDSPSFFSFHLQFIMFFTAVKSYFHTLAVSLPAQVSAVCGTPVSDFPVHHRMLRRCCR